MKIVAPERIYNEVKKASDGFLELQNTEVEFRIRKNLRGSIMMAQPNFKDLFKNKRQRRYIILVSETFTIGSKTFSTLKLPSKIKVGWFAHELGHIQDYLSLSTFGLLRFGVLYLVSKEFMKAAELRADTFATRAGYGEFLITTKNFILNHTELPESYKAKIRKYYPSPDQILEIDKDFTQIDEVT